MASSASVSASSEHGNHLEKLQCLAVSLKRHLYLGSKPQPQIVKIDSYIDYLSKRCEKIDNKPACSQTPPLSTDVKTPKCRLEGIAICYSTGYICFRLQGSRLREETDPKPIRFDVKVFLRHPYDGDPWMIGEKQFVLKDNQMVCSPQIVTTYKDIQQSNCLKNDTIHFWWQVWVRQYPKEIDQNSIKEIAKAISLETIGLRELCTDDNINKIADTADSICKCLKPPGVLEPSRFCYRIDKIEEVLTEYKEMYTPLCESSSHGYPLQGFLICREDNSLAAYLYLGPLKQIDEVIWPVKLQWRISLVNQASGQKEIMGNMINVYDKATPADTSLLDFESRIEFNKEKIDSYGLVVNQSLTVEWCVWLDSPIYAVNATELTHLCDQLLKGVEDLLGPDLTLHDQIETKALDDFVLPKDLKTQDEKCTTVYGNFDLMLIGKSNKAKRVAGNSILQQQDFTIEVAEDEVKEAWRQFDDHIVTVVDCPLICNLKPEETDRHGTAGHRLAKALVKSGDGFHAILFVIRMDKTFSHEEYESVRFLRTHLADNVVRDFFVCVLIGKNESNKKSEDEFDLLGWCKRQTGRLGDLFKECNFRCLVFYNTTDELSINETQRQKMLSLVNEMKSREFRLKKRCLDWNRIPGANYSNDSTDGKMEIILKRTQVFLQDLKDARQVYEDPVAAKCQIDELENKAVLLEKEISTCDEDGNIINTLKAAIMNLKETLASTRNSIKKTQSLKDLIKSLTARCIELKEELGKTKVEYEKLKTQSKDAEVLRKTFDNLKLELDMERSSLKKYKEQYEALVKEQASTSAFFQIQILMWTKVYEEMSRQRQEMHEQEIRRLQDFIQKQNENQQKKDSGDIEKLKQDIEVHKQEKEGLKKELEIVKKNNEDQQKMDAEDTEKLKKEMEDHKLEKESFKEELEKVKKTMAELEKRLQEQVQDVPTQSDTEAPDPEDEKMYQILNQSGYDLHAVDGNVQTALMKAAREGYGKSLKFLIESQANVDNLDKDGKTALMFAAEKGSEKCVRLLVEAKCKVNECGKNDGKTALILAVERRSEDCVKLLIEAQSEVDKCDNEGKTALMIAAEKQAEKCLNLLINAKSDVNKCDNDGKTALMHAAEKECVECMKMLTVAKSEMDKGDKRGKTALMIAAEKRSKECVKLLIEGNCEVNKRDNDGKTALIIAAMKGSGVCVQMLIEANAGVDDCDSWGRTALMFAARKGSHECVKLLIEANAEVNKCEKIRRTALMFAAQKGSHECVKLLIEAKSELSKCDKGGKTALMFAAEEGSHECVKLLNEARSAMMKLEKARRTAPEKGSDD